jgi:hypothetical protein
VFTTHHCLHILHTVTSLLHIAESVLYMSIRNSMQQHQNMLHNRSAPHRTLEHQHASHCAGDYNTAPDRHLGAAALLRPRPDLLITEATYATTLRDSKKSRERDLLTEVSMRKAVYEMYKCVPGVFRSRRGTGASRSY